MTSQCQGVSTALLLICLFTLTHASEWTHYEEDYKGGGRHARSAPLGPHGYKGKLLPGTPHSPNFFMDDLQIYPPEPTKVELDLSEYNGLIDRNPYSSLNDKEEEDYEDEYEDSDDLKAPKDNPSIGHRLANKKSQQVAIDQKKSLVQGVTKTNTP